jgi:hypothetical protein
MPTAPHDALPLCNCDVMYLLFISEALIRNTPIENSVADKDCNNDTNQQGYNGTKLEINSYTLIPDLGSKAVITRTSVLCFQNGAIFSTVIISAHIVCSDKIKLCLGNYPAVWTSVDYVSIPN